MEHVCINCNKFYASYKSLWLHKYKYHKIPVVENVVVKNNVVKNVVENVVKNNICKKCNKHLADRISRWKHEKICTQKNLEKENKEIKKELLEIKNEKDKEILELRKEMEKMKDIIQKSLKIHPKTLQKINTQLNNNGTINNITIVQLGKENLSELLTKQEKIGILNRQAMGINDIVELAHTSGKYKKCMNVYITNLQNTIGYMYDEKQNNFIAVNKNELLNELLDSRMYDIEKFYEEFQEKINADKAEKIKKFIDRKNNDEDCLKGLKKEEIKLILYNNKEAISAILPKNKEIEIIDYRFMMNKIFIHQ
jgi:hypothetical protein